MKRGGPIVRVVKKADDPITPTRVSLGGVVMEEALIGYYCVYRGTKEAAIEACEHVLKGLRALKHEPPITPDEGKHYS
jgi:hypothetical protein